MYQIAFSPHRNLISVKLSGMFCVEEVARYVAELSDGFVRHRYKTGYLMLIDVTDCTVQSQDVMIALQAHMAAFPKASRLAVVSGNTLARMQVRRVMKQPYMRIVDTVHEGEQWLLSRAASPAAVAQA